MSTFVKLVAIGRTLFDKRWQIGQRYSCFSTLKVLLVILRLKLCNLLKTLFSEKATKSVAKEVDLLRKTTSLKKGSDKMIYWNGRYTFLLVFYFVKTPKRFVILCSIKKLNTQTYKVVLHNKTQKERLSTDSINYLIRPHL